MEIDVLFVALCVAYLFFCSVSIRRQIITQIIFLRKKYPLKSELSIRKRAFQNIVLKQSELLLGTPFFISICAFMQFGYMQTYSLEEKQYNGKIFVLSLGISICVLVLTLLIHWISIARYYVKAKQNTVVKITKEIISQPLES